jgi:phosphatidate cytidylyltransferase
MRPRARLCVLRTRILTAAVVLPPLLAFVILAPAWSISLLVALCAAWGLYEVAAMMAADAAPALALLIITGALPAIVALTRWAPQLSAMLAGVGVAAMCVLIGWVNVHPTQKTPPRSLLIAIAGLYVGALYPYLALLRNGTGGVALLLILLLVVMAGDSGAYFVGRAIGRIRLMPAVSPGKTVEGAIAYVACSVVAACALNAALGVGWSVGTAAGFGGLISIAAQAGDLAESALKRLAGVKDSGWLFPGHGGMLDRADSLVFAAVFAYYYSWWLGLAAA